MAAAESLSTRSFFSSALSELAAPIRKRGASMV
jgi:hypothetical protein